MNALDLTELLRRWPALGTIWNPRFLRRVMPQGQLPLWLSQLTADPSDEEMLRDLDVLDERLRRLSGIQGFSRMTPGLRSRNTDEWSHTYLEMQVLEHFQAQNVLQEIRPQLPGTRGAADFLLSVRSVPVWGEVTQFEALRQARLSRGVRRLLSPDEEWAARTPRLLQKLSRQTPKSNWSFVVINARRTIQRMETWEPVARQVFRRLPMIAAIVFRARHETRLFKNPAPSAVSTAAALDAMWADHQL